MILIDTPQGPQSVDEGSLFLVDVPNFRDSHLTNSITPFGGMVVSLDKHNGSVSVVVLAFDSSRCKDFLLDFEKKQSVLQIRGETYTSLEIDSKLLQGLLLGSMALSGEETVGHIAGLPIYLISTTTSFDRFGNYAIILPERSKNVESWPFVGFHLWLRQSLKMTSDDLYDIKELIRYKGRFEILSKFRIESIMRMRTTLLKLKGGEKSVIDRVKASQQRNGDPLRIQIRAINPELAKACTIHSADEVYVQDIRAILHDTAIREKTYASMGLFYSQYAPKQIFQLLSINTNYCRVNRHNDETDIQLPNNLLLAQGFIPDYGIICIDEEPIHIMVRHTEENENILDSVERTIPIERHSINFITSREILGTFSAYRYSADAVNVLAEAVCASFIAAAEHIKFIINALVRNARQTPGVKYMNVAYAVAELTRIGLNPVLQAALSDDGRIHINPDDVTSPLFHPHVDYPNNEDERGLSFVELTPPAHLANVAAPANSFDREMEIRALYERKKPTPVSGWYQDHNQAYNRTNLPEPERATEEEVRVEADNLHMSDAERRMLIEEAIGKIQKSNKRLDEVIEEDFDEDYDEEDNR